MWPLLLLWGMHFAFFAYIRNGLFVGGCTFFYSNVFVTMSCDHVKMFPSFILKGCFAFFAYIRMLCLLLCHVTMWKSFLLFIMRHKRFFAYLREVLWHAFFAYIRFVELHFFLACDHEKNFPTLFCLYKVACDHEKVEEIFSLLSHS